MVWYHLVNSLVNPSNMIYFEVFELTFLFAIVETLKIGPTAMINSQPQLVCLLQMTNCLGNKRPLILCYKKKGAFHSFTFFPTFQLFNPNHIPNNHRQRTSRSITKKRLKDVWSRTAPTSVGCPVAVPCGGWLVVRTPEGRRRRGWNCAMMGFSPGGRDHQKKGAGVFFFFVSAVGFGWI